jgi:hypothetical protein
VTHRWAYFFARKPHHAHTLDHEIGSGMAVPVGVLAVACIDNPAAATSRSRGVEQTTDPVTGCRGRDGLAVRVDIGRTRAVSKQ